MYHNSDITLYSKVNNSYTRQAIKDVFWNEVKESNTIKSGLTTADKVKIFIPITSAKNLNLTTGTDIIVKGIVDYEIDNTTQQTQSTTLNQLKKDYSFVTISSCDAKLFGSEKMQHYVVSCK